MIIPYAPQHFSVCARPWYRVLAAAVAMATLFVLLTGCGGGSGTVAAVSSPPSQLPTDSRATLVDAEANAFSPNYTPKVESDGTWSGRTVRVYVPASEEAVFLPALNRWAEATSGFFNWELVANKNEAQITFAIVPTTDFTEGVAGKTQYTYDTDRAALISAHVSIADTGPDADKVRAAVHELGHALGIHGHSDAEPDVMYSTLTTRNVITGRDLNTLFFLYKDSDDGNVSTSRSMAQEKTVTILCQAKNSR